MNVTCSICQQEFDCESNFANHFTIKHTISTLDPSDEKMEKIHNQETEILVKTNCRFNSSLFIKLDCVCQICKGKFSSPCQLAHHIFTHIGAMPYFCTICNFSTISKKHLQNHLYKHELEVSAKEKQVWRPLILTDSHECEICRSCFVSWIELTNHYVDHLKQMPFTCKTCNLLFNEKKDYIIHCHLHKDTSICDLCYTFFNTRFEFLKHVISHNRSKLFRKFEFHDVLLNNNSSLSRKRAISIQSVLRSPPKSADREDLNFKKSVPCLEVGEQNHDTCASTSIISTCNSSSIVCTDRSHSSDSAFNLIKSAENHNQDCLPEEGLNSSKIMTDTSNESGDGNNISSNLHSLGECEMLQDMRELSVVLTKLPRHVRTMRSYRRYAALLKNKIAKERRLNNIKAEKSSRTMHNATPLGKTSAKEAYCSPKRHHKSEFETHTTVESSSFEAVDAMDIEKICAMDGKENMLNGECQATKSYININRLEKCHAISFTETLSTDMHCSPERETNGEFSNDTCDFETPCTSGESSALMSREDENAENLSAMDRKLNELSVECHVTDLSHFEIAKARKIKRRRKPLTLRRKKRIKNTLNHGITPDGLKLNNSSSQLDLSKDGTTKPLHIEMKISASDLEASCTTAKSSPLTSRESENAEGFCTMDCTENKLGVLPKKNKMKRRRFWTVKKKRGIRNTLTHGTTPDKNTRLNLNNSSLRLDLSKDGGTKMTPCTEMKMAASVESATHWNTKSFRYQQTSENAFNDQFQVEAIEEHIKHNPAQAQTCSPDVGISNSVFQQNQILTENGSSPSDNMVKNSEETKPGINSSDFTMGMVPEFKSINDIISIVKNLKELSVVLIKLPDYVRDMSSYKTFLQNQNSGKVTVNVKKRNLCSQGKICHNKISKNKQPVNNVSRGDGTKRGPGQYLGVVSSMILRRKQNKSYKFNSKTESIQKSENKANSVTPFRTDLVKDNLMHPRETIQMGSANTVGKFEEDESDTDSTSCSDDSLLDLLGSLPDVLGPTSISTGPIKVDKPCKKSADSLLGSSKKGKSKESKLLSPRSVPNVYLGKSMSSNVKINSKSENNSIANRVKRRISSSPRSTLIDISSKQSGYIGLKTIQRRIANIRRFLTLLRNKDYSTYLSRSKKLNVNLHKLPDHIYQTHLKGKPIMLSLILPVVEHVYSLQDARMMTTEEIMNEHNYFKPHFYPLDAREHNYCKTSLLD